MIKKALCFGLEPYPLPGYSVDLCSLIEIASVPFQSQWQHQLDTCTHLLFTSKTAVELFHVSEKPVFAIGQGTANRAKHKGFNVVQIAPKETQEGICQLLQEHQNISLFWPRSDKARSVIHDFCQVKGFTLFDPPIYTIRFKEIALPNLKNYDALFFTSPSTVEAFFALKAAPFSHLQLFSIGVVTEKYLIDRVSLLEEKSDATCLSSWSALPRRLSAP